MRFIFIALACCACACRKSNHLLPGLWEIDKIEIRKNDELKKVIDGTPQYWNIYKNDSIEIFNESQVQNCLRIRIRNNLIKSVDRSNLPDEFSIDKLDATHLELSSRKKIQEADYTVVYYLEKVTDLSAEDIKSGY